MLLPNVGYISYGVLDVGVVTDRYPQVRDADRPPIRSLGIVTSKRTVSTPTYLKGSHEGRTAIAIASSNCP